MMCSKRLHIHGMLQFQVVLFCLFTVTVLNLECVLSESATSVNCGAVIEDEYQARRCFNLQADTVTPPLPVMLESTVESGFVCKSTKPLYTFSCSVYSFDLIWYINNEIVTAFLPFDTTGAIFRSSYPALAPIYNITTTLTQQTSVSVGEQRLRLATSTLIVQPFNESQIEAIPFTVSCQAHCENENFTEVCQSRLINVAAKPAKPSKVYCSIHIVDNISLSLLNWESSQNQNETAIDYYDITLLRNHSNSTNISIHVAASMQTLSYKYAVLDGSCTTAIITAVDLCGQRSDTSEFQLISITNTNPGSSDGQKIQRTDVLTGLLIFAFAIIFVLCVVFVAVTVTICRHFDKQKLNAKFQDDRNLCTSGSKVTAL